ncbi:MAG: response regulator transcription factor [Gemmatimonadetes bacterium]|nr:response regulator transcription factor [Gemmatimonadota bacterium]
MTTVLVAYPDADVVRAVARATVAWRYRTLSTTDPSMVRTMAVSAAPDLVIMGCELPGETAATICELKEYVRTRVVALAPAAFDYEKLVAAGADRVVSPWARRMELRRAVRWALHMAVLERRFHATPTIRLGPVTFMGICGVMFMEGRGGCCLTRIEAALFRLLAARPGEVVPHHELIKAAWPKVPCRLVPRTRMQVHIHNLRRKLEAWGPTAPRIELSCWNGYRLVPHGEVTVIRHLKAA